VFIQFYQRADAVKGSGSSGTISRTSGFISPGVSNFGTLFHSCLAQQLTHSITVQTQFERIGGYGILGPAGMIPRAKPETFHDRPSAMFIADDPGLDFLNSIGTPVDTVVEWIPNGEDLLGWLAQAKLIDPGQADAIRTNTFPGELDEVAAQARALREWFRGFVLTHMGRPLTAKTLKLLEPLNKVLERDEGYGAIVPRSTKSNRRRAPSGLEWRPLRRWSTPNALLLPIAEALAQLVCSEDFSLIRACEGKACTFLFLDKTHGRARRWCSMAVCGNRAKQAAHRQRSARKLKKR
jgi:predicted RNA-binding Zn ribbon-like protein